MNINNEDDKLIERASTWMQTAFVQIYEAGGSPSNVIAQFPPSLLKTLIRNNIQLKYVKPASEVKYGS